jgi:membrane associated rhomboid family serine protease
LNITYALLGITVAISFYAFNNSNVLRGFINNPYLINTRGQYYRFVTSGFIHRDHIHLLLNMVTFYFFGGAIERVFGMLFGDWGGLYFIALYLMAIVVSDIPTYFKQRHNPGYNSLGASGGVSAIVFAFILLLPMEKICLYYVLCVRGFILGTIFIGYSYYMGRKANDGINHDAHLYGAVFGLIFCIILYPESLPRFIEQVSQWSLFD